MIDEKIKIKDLLDALDNNAFLSIDISKDMSSIFKETIRKNRFFKGIVLTDLSGLTIAYYSPDYPSNYLEYVLGPSTGVILATAEKTIDGTSNTKIKNVLIEGDKENVFISTVNANYVLGVLVDSQAPKGLILRDLINLLRKIKEVLKSNGIT